MKEKELIRLSNQELRDREFEMLKFIKQVCEDNNIFYSLCGGTLLGAVRHAGFIPWDDDIDVYMNRAGFEKFKAILKKNELRYKLLSPGDAGYYYVFGKLVDSETTLVEKNCAPILNMGIWVDIFILDGMPNNESERDRHYKKIRRLRRKITSFSQSRIIFRKNIVLMILSTFSLLRNILFPKYLCLWQRKYVDLVEKYDFDECQYVYPSGSAYGFELYEKSMIQDRHPITFEGEVFYGFADNDAYLKIVYGDYMTLPPENRRFTHEIECYKK